MPSSGIAEWILALFLTRERSAAVVGDLKESMPSCGLFWFWSSVLRTAFSLLWATLKAEPGFMVWLGVRASLISVVLMYALDICYLLLLKFVLLPLATPGHGSTVGYAGVLGLCIGFAAIGFQIGCWVARRAPGREVAACAVLCIAQLALTQLIRVMLVAISNGPNPAPDPVPQNPSAWILTYLVQPFLYVVPLWGALRVRNRAIGHFHDIGRSA